MLSSSPGLSDESGTGASGIGVVTGAIATCVDALAALLGRRFAVFLLADALRGEAFFAVFFAGFVFLAAGFAAFFALFRAVFLDGRRAADFADFLVALRFFVVAICYFPFCLPGLAQPNKILDVCLRTLLLNLYMGAVTSLKNRYMDTYPSFRIN